MAVQPKEQGPEGKGRKPVVVLVNNKPVTLPDADTTGKEIKALAGIPLDFKLYGPKGDEVKNDQRIKVHPREKFTAISGQDVS